MNYIKPEPVGIDKAIQSIQTRLYNKLGFTGLDGFGRIYPIRQKGNLIPAHFVGGTEYKEVLFNDQTTESGNFFFHEEARSTKINPSEWESTVHIIFQLEPFAVTSEYDQRNDEEIRAKIEKILNRTAFILTDIVRGVEALNAFDNNLGDRKYILLRYTGKLRYQINC